MSDWLIHHGDVLSVLPALPSHHFDCIVTDPPYGDTSLEWDKVVDGWAQLALRTLKPTGSMWVFGSFRYFADAFVRGTFEAWKIAQDVVWEKHNGSSFHADRFKRVHELAVQFYPRSNQWSQVFKCPQHTQDATRRTVRRKQQRTPHTGEIAGSTYVSEDGGPRLMRSVIYARSCHGHAEHPTQKPEAIVSPLVNYSCPTGGIVLDPFMGSGTTGVVCVKNGRRFIGIEIDESYVEISRRRIGEAANHLFTTVPEAS